MPRGVFHCFTDTWELAAAALDRGFYIGITGIVTFPNSENVRDVARRIPLDRLLVETDAPFCTPDPLRTERRQQRKKGREEPNEPAFVALVCQTIAELHGVTVDEVRRQTRENTRALFGLA
jgi:TatD DNase family protein